MQRRLTLLVFLLLMLAGCGARGPGTTLSGGNPAAPPAPPAEIPALRFPESIAEIGVSTVASSGSGALAALAIGDDISDTIRDTALNTIFFYDLVDNILEPLHQMIIPVGLNNHFEDLIIVGDDLINVKIDFSNYGGRGCSGHTAALPICYQIWLDDQRAFFGQFDAFPTEANSGAGELTGRPPFNFLGVVPFDVSLDYDFQDPLTKALDLAVLLQIEPTEKRPARVMIDQVPFAGSLLKTIRSSFSTVDEGAFRFINRWIDDQDYWSGTRFQESADPGFNFEAFCALISSGIVVERDECIKRNIDVGDIAPALEPLPSEFAFPPDFSTEPPF